MKLSKLLLAASISLIGCKRNSNLGIGVDVSNAKIECLDGMTFVAYRNTLSQVQDSLGHNKTCTSSDPLNLFNNDTTHTIGKIKVFPNGRRGQWDGIGWKALPIAGDSAHPLAYRKGYSILKGYYYVVGDTIMESFKGDSIGNANIDSIFIRQK